jgi:hypothetical protein
MTILPVNMYSLRISGQAIASRRCGERWRLPRLDQANALGHLRVVAQVLDLQDLLHVDQHRIARAVDLTAALHELPLRGRVGLVDVVDVVQHVDVPVEGQPAEVHL